MLYRTYRPTTWDEVIGQEHVVRTLQGALKSGHIGHAYLFAGPRGTGKTTLARLFAKAIMKVDPADEQPMDLIEIDAASNRGIDDIRALKETASTSPITASHKVFIIDEAHQITKEAFNAFLKLLEEPPAHAVFILATTEAHKLIPTVLSRVQRFDFKKLTQQQIVSKLQTIAAAEKIDLEGEAAAIIASASDGAMRDAEVMLTKLSNHAGNHAVTAKLCHDVLGLVPVQWHAQLLTHLAARDRAAAMTFLTQVGQAGADWDQFAKGFLQYLRQVMIAKIDPAILVTAGMALAESQSVQLTGFTQTLEGAFLIKMIQVFTLARQQLRSSPIPALPLELAVIELTAPTHG